MRNTHTMVRQLDNLHLRLRRSRWLWRTVVVTRILLATAFIPTGLVKVLGLRFTMLSVEHPAGAFFEALYRTGTYWQFLGWGQVIAGVLLLVPATATLGAFLFLPIAVNIVVITLTLGFTGTPWVTVPMLFAVCGLIAWDYDRWKRVLFSSPAVTPASLPPLRWAGLERALVVACGAGSIAVFLGTRSLLPSPGPAIGLIAGALAATGLFVLWLAQDRAHRRANRENAS